MKKIIIFGMMLGVLFYGAKISYAASQDECAIWLCLPGGFPSGCSAAHSAFKDRIKHGKSPLPDLSSCMSGSVGSKSNGKYEMGIEYFVPCKSGFELNQSKWNSSRIASCVPTSPLCSLRVKYRRKPVDCTTYNAAVRSQPRYIKMWVDDKYLGQFFYR